MALGARRFNQILAQAGLAPLCVDDEWAAFSTWSDRQELVPGMKGLSKLDPDDFEDVYIEVYDTVCGACISACRCLRQGQW